MAEQEFTSNATVEGFQRYFLAKLKEQIATQERNQAIEDAAFAAVIAERGFYTVTIGDCWPSKRRWKPPTLARPAWRRPGVYVVKDSDGAVLYVGYSSSPSFRIGQHCGHRSTLGAAIRDSQPGSLLWTVDLYFTEGRDQGLARELEMIRALQPTLNEKCKALPRRARR